MFYPYIKIKLKPVISVNSVFYFLFDADAPM